MSLLSGLAFTTLLGNPDAEKIKNIHPQAYLDTTGQAKTELVISLGNQGEELGKDFGKHRGETLGKELGEDLREDQQGDQQEQKNIPADTIQPPYESDQSHHKGFISGKSGQDYAGLLRSSNQRTEMNRSETTEERAKIITILPNKESKPILVGDKRYTIRITPQHDITQKSPEEILTNDRKTEKYNAEKYNNNEPRGQLIVQNEETGLTQRLDRISIDLNRLGRRGANDEIKELSTKGKPVERITGLTVGEKTVTIHGKMLKEDFEDGEEGADGGSSVNSEKKRSLADSIVEYSQPIDRALFDKFFDPSLFHDGAGESQEKTVTIDASEVLQGRAYEILKEKYGSLTAMGAKMGVTDINLHFQSVTEQTYE